MHIDSRLIFTVSMVVTSLYPVLPIDLIGPRCAKIHCIVNTLERIRNKQNTIR